MHPVLRLARSTIVRNHHSGGSRNDFLKVPLRLFDCFGFAVPSIFDKDLSKDFDCFFCALFETLGILEGIVEGWRTGDDRKAEGEGIVIVSM